MKKIISLIFGFIFSGCVFSQTINDNPSSYKECSGIYYKGCKDKAGENYIVQIQECLGVKKSGLFDKQTEDALYRKTRKRKFKIIDIKDICTPDDEDDLNPNN